MTEKKKTFGFMEKIKRIKHIEIIVLVLFSAIMMLVVFGNFQGEKSNSTQSTALTAYAESLEKRMSKILSQINGAGSVSVLVYFERGAELVPAMNETTIVLVGGKPVVLTEVQPIVSGVIVVAEGADSIKVKLELLRAVETLLKVDGKNVEIFSKQRGRS